jgi:ketopantoate reductase
MTDLTNEQVAELREAAETELMENSAGRIVAPATTILALINERERLKRRLSEHSDYSIDLARIIEGLCSGGPIREPQTGARHHYDMAVAALRKSEERAGKLARLVQVFLDNEPDDLVADGGVTVLDVWRQEARRATLTKDQQDVG